MSSWINVKDILPEHEEVVLIYGSDSNQVELALFHKSDVDYLFLDHNKMNRQFRGVTHWMSIPPLEDNSIENEPFRAFDSFGDPLCWGCDNYVYWFNKPIDNKFYCTSCGEDLVDSKKKDSENGA
jgi:hypothetical protein